MKASTKARRLQDRIAYYVLAKRKMPKEIIISREYRAAKVWHLDFNGPQMKEAHCISCTCHGRTRGIGAEYVTSLCKSLAYRTNQYPYKYPRTTDLQDYRSCKHCLQALAKIANEA